MKIFITIDITDFSRVKTIDEEVLYKSKVTKAIDFVYEMIELKIPTQIKITNLPPQRGDKR